MESRGIQTQEQNVDTGLEEGNVPQDVQTDYGQESDAAFDQAGTFDENSDDDVQEWYDDYEDSPYSLNNEKRRQEAVNRYRKRRRIMGILSLVALVSLAVSVILGYRMLTRAQIESAKVQAQI